MKMPRSTFYYKKRKRAAPTDEALLALIRHILEEFVRYGYRRVTVVLHRNGFPVNHKRVYRVMREHRLVCLRRKKFKVYTTDSNHPYPIHPNLVRDLVIVRLNQVWIADITYIRIATGFVYLAVILDLCSRKAIGYALSERIDKELALAALRMALENRRPPAGCIHHSDRGVQYASHEYVDLLRAHGLRISMSRKGNVYDNATAESFMKTLKNEEVDLSDYQTFQDVVANIFPFIGDVYNHKRLHSSLGYMTPVEFEATFEKKAG